ncbi:UDP-glucose 4-epimerase GalE [Ramlibacter tataouinensis]|uniref:UDP-glucose 4-epimerase n=1 Tax=Ramlibacter tataouinensis (strain ATCC BAA-407 / DSM 14655 / LMG 21543 / TTB310) TaxID=365046 RepID=F5Y5P6_RAMTT|nr:UDP-glucose 4-epimerase GalE [Ramlibacter tataouinensis]AEG93930.1 UDP- galactose 4-epimerase [Ramlibacter tataouinensis TTB310]
MNARVLVTGGAGYIGSHTAVVLMQAGLDVVILDNLCNSSALVLDRLERVCSRRPEFVQADARDAAALDGVFARHRIDGVIHFAGLKAVGESVAQPLRYFDNNLGSTVTLLQAMERAGVRRLVFSSSATVYGDASASPIPETAPLAVTNPYGRSKLMCEDMLRDLAQADPRWHIAILRYFNPVGAHPSGLIGESPRGTPANLMPYLVQVAGGQRESLQIFGSDYPTPDGTGVRDFIHVMDLAEGHLAALRYLERKGTGITVNLGTGRGVSVRQMLDTFQRVTGRAVAHRYADRRPGDVAVCYADAGRALQHLGWQARLGLERMCEDAWRWQAQNPAGYGG